MASSTRQTLIDERGYVFLFPSLGIPDPKGEWISLRAAIGTQDVATPILENPDTQAPLRFPTGQEHVIDLEQDGVVWQLPCLKPETIYKDPEIFTVRVRRFPLATAPPNPQRLQAPPGKNSICLIPPPKRLNLKVITGPGPEFDSIFSEAKKKGKYDFIHSSSAKKKGRKNRRATLDSDTDDTAGEEGSGAEEQEKKIEDWSKKIQWSGREGQSKLIIFDPQYLQTILMDFFIEALRTNTMKQGEGPKVKLRARPCAGDDFKDLDYAIRPKGDNRPVKEEEWKLLPYHGAKGGVHLYCLNLARKHVGKKEWSKEEWEARVKGKGKGQA